MSFLISENFHCKKNWIGCAIIEYCTKFRFNGSTDPDFVTNDIQVQMGIYQYKLLPLYEIITFLLVYTDTHRLFRWIISVWLFLSLCFYWWIGENIIVPYHYLLLQTTQRNWLVLNLWYPLQISIKSFLETTSLLYPEIHVKNSISVKRLTHMNKEVTLITFIPTNNFLLLETIYFEIDLWYIGLKKIV